MFTGIVEEIGVVLNIQKGEKSTSLLIEAKKVIENTKVGDSICTNGVCLTVTRITDNYMDVDVMPETLRRTDLGKLQVGSKVNLERALTLNSRLGGHIVSGHIDGVGTISHIEREDNAIWFKIDAPMDILRYIVEKGSITVDGISLTVAYVDEKSFKVSIIPHTAEETILITKSVGEEVNLECDILAKYIEKLIKPKEEVKSSISEIDEKFLIENGFM
ncbi:MAG: riboflavin synthase [Clostridium sp.]|uniref:riboflavin synthase n=1 Tax=Clostridium sp. DSM 8431 TaxID=1761781 RepID=UPI0008E5BA13|nr:riboflavin synthase [Clostridium sp. DSM 8431]MCR4943795.1 riboflavin synthase [Clostridium sp.]SFU29193.1 riboflavin synthase alpha chain [Clostridium sp. DSM 8431]